MYRDRMVYRCYFGLTCVKFLTHWCVNNCLEIDFHLWVQCWHWYNAFCDRIYHQYEYLRYFKIILDNSSPMTNPFDNFPHPFLQLSLSIRNYKGGVVRGGNSSRLGIVRVGMCPRRLSEGKFYRGNGMERSPIREVRATHQHFIPYRLPLLINDIACLH